MSRTAGSKNVAPVAVAAIVMVDEDMPIVKRATTENPFSAFVAPMAARFLAGETVKPKGFDIPLENLDQTLRLLGNAGREHGVTVRKVVRHDEKTAHITFTVKTMEKRTRKATDKV